MARVLFIFFSILISSFTTRSLAFVNEPIPGNVDVIYTDDTSVDLSTKIWLIDRAQKSVQISAFIMGKDQYGLNIARALRRALIRGVDVQLMYEGIPSMILAQDYFLRISDLLTDPRLPKKAQVLNMGVREKRKTKLALNDYMHEKFFIIDANTANETIYIGGRDLSSFSRITVDSGYFIRPLDRHQRYVGDDIKEYYSGLWNLLSRHFKTVSTTVDDANKALDILNEMSSATLISNSTSQYLDLIRLLQVKPRVDDVLASNQFRPLSTQFFANKFIQKILTRNYEKQFGVREELILEDPILRALVKIVDQSKSVQISSYSADYASPLVTAMSRLLSRGRLTIYTNGWSAMNEMDAIGISELSFEYSLKSIMKLKSQPESQTNFAPYVLDRDKALKQTSGLKSYLHRKLMLADSHLVVTGSYNFTDSSSAKNDEYIIVFNDPKMNAHHSQLNNQEQHDFYKVQQVTGNEKYYFFKNIIKNELLYDFVKSQY